MFLQSHYRVVVEVIIMVVADAYNIDNWNIFNLTRNFSVAFRAHELHRTASI